MDNRPIGIFDSGVGGLTVLKNYLKELPNENYIYFGDTARLPYGSKSEDTIIEFSKQITDFLISKDVKLIVIACGTASAIAYKYLSENYDVPIIDIISPTAGSINDSSVGVIATKATIKNGAWEREILKQSPSCKITSLACPLFVPIVEEGLISSDIAKLTVTHYLSSFGKDISSLVLGCTHYPLLEDMIQEEVGNNVQLINPGVHAALYTRKALTEKDMLNTSNPNPYIEFYSSDSEDYFKNIAKNFFPIEKYNIITKVL